jgi:hypothetical protein
MNYYIAVNGYRSSTSNGFANTWGIYKCRSRKQQLEILKNGLPVHDCWYQDDEGRHSPVFSTMGVRSLCGDEYRAVKNRFKNQDHSAFEPLRLSWVDTLLPKASPVDADIEIEPYRR